MVDEKIFVNNTLDYMITLSPQDFHCKIFEIHYYNLYRAIN